MNNILTTYLDLMDDQREQILVMLKGLSEAEIWRRPSPKNWSIGEILDHNHLLFASSLPVVKFAWFLQKKRALKRKQHPYQFQIEDPYHKSSFPMWVGFLWKPRHTPKKPVTMDQLASEQRSMHAAVRTFFKDKPPALLGNVFIFDPFFGGINLIITLRIGIFHDQLHYEDIARLVQRIKTIPTDR